MAATRLASKTRIYLDVKQMLDITIGVVKNFPKSQRPILETDYVICLLIV